MREIFETKIRCVSDRCPKKDECAVYHMSDYNMDYDYKFNGCDKLSDFTFFKPLNEAKGQHESN